jgi:hypothetical protein
MDDDMPSSAERSCAARNSSSHFEDTIQFVKTNKSRTSGFRIHCERTDGGSRHVSANVLQIINPHSGACNQCCNTMEETPESQIEKQQCIQISKIMSLGGENRNLNILTSVHDQFPGSRPETPGLWCTSSKLMNRLQFALYLETWPYRECVGALHGHVGTVTALIGSI